MVEKDGFTYGVVADPQIIPYRLPYQKKGEYIIWRSGEKPAGECAATDIFTCARKSGFKVVSRKGACFQVSHVYL